ncbi:MAG TPA: hypothetical protein VJM32_05715 [Candidatus Saccharimonadales bacterium]|nr:hypothetical protein [Candidatus Saccharimonadales bacterium]
MTVDIGEIWHPSQGVNQLNLSLGRGVNVPLETAIAQFQAVDGVKGAGAAMGMWGRGHIDLSLSSADLPPELRAKLQAVCDELLRIG